MSFILDALKKSESDRQRQTGPSLFEVKVAPPRRTLPIWAIAIAVLLGINIIVVSWMLLRRPAAQQPAAVGSAPAAAPAPAANSGAAPSVLPGGHASGADVMSGRSLPESARPPVRPGGTAPTGPAPTAAAAGAGSGGPPAAAAGPPQASRAASPDQAPAAAPPATGQNTDQNADQPPAGGNSSDYAPAVQPAAGSGGPGGATGELPIYQQIASSAGLPDLHLDLHVFADRPQDRFVMINMHRLGEGGSLPNGVQVVAIRPDGVVLTYRGSRFLLPRN